MKLAFNAAGFRLGSGLWPWECFLGVGLLWLVFGMAWLIRGFSSSVGGTGVGAGLLLYGVWPVSGCFLVSWDPGS